MTVAVGCVCCVVYGLWLVACPHVCSYDSGAECVLVPVAHQHTVSIGLRHVGGVGGVEEKCADKLDRSE